MKAATIQRDADRIGRRFGERNMTTETLGESADLHALFVSRMNEPTQTPENPVELPEKPVEPAA